MSNHHLTAIYTHYLEFLLVKSNCLRMKFSCFVCNKSFEIKDEAVSHLKSVHRLKDNAQPIKCVVKGCAKSYLSFKALKQHVNQCEKKIPICESQNESVTNICENLTSVKHFNSNYVLHTHLFTFEILLGYYFAFDPSIPAIQ